MNRQSLLDLIICAVEGIILFYFVCRVLERRFKNYIVMFCSCAVHVFTIYIINTAPIAVKIPVSVTVFFIMCILNFTDRITIIAGTVAYAFYIIIASDFIFADLISILQKTEIYSTISSYENITIAFAITIKIINFLLYYVSITYFKKINKNSKGYSIITLDTIFLCFLLISTFLVIMYPTVTYNPQQMTLYFILSTVFFVTSFLILRLYVRLCDYFEKDQYWTVADIKYKSLNYQMDLQNEFIESSAKTMHDIKKILETINYLNQQNQYDSLSKFLDELSLDSYSQKPVIYCNDQFINSVLNIKMRECESKGITMSIQVAPMIESKVKSDNLILILSNILDNAIEAVYKTEEENKTVVIKIYNYENNLIIYSENKYIQDISKKRFFQSTKAESHLHGYGIRIIEELVRTNDGQVSFEPDKDLFKVTIMIPS